MDGRALLGSADLPSSPQKCRSHLGFSLGPEATGYQILRRQPEQCEFGFRVYVDDTGNAEPRWIDTDAEPGTLYEYHVRAINDFGAGWLDWSISTSIRPATLEAGDQPNSPATGTPTISGTVQVGETLTADTSGIDDDDGLTGARFFFQWLSGEDTEIAGATSATYAPVSTDEGKTIKVRVNFTDDALYQEALTSSATAEVAAGSELTQVEVTPPDDNTAPGESLGLWSRWSVRGEPDGIVLHWRGPPGPVTGYQILRSEPYGCTTQMVVHVDDTGSDATTYMDTDVAEGVTYIYRVRAINSNGVGGRSGFTNQQYRPHGWWPSGGPGAPYSPRNLEGARIYDGTELQGIELSWEAPNIGAGAEVTGYQILRRLPEECEHGYRVYVENTNSTDTRWTDTDVEIGILYEYHVRAVNDVGPGFLARSSSVTVNAATVPAEPLSLIVTSRDQIRELDASWQAPPSNGGSDVTGYKVQWKEADDSWDTADVSEATVTGTTHTITSLTGGVEYTVRVRAVNDVGEGSPSAEASGTPQQAAIWSTTLTVGVVAETFAGYTTFLPDSTVLGALSSDTITLDDASYTVKALGVLNGKLILSVMPKLTGGFVLVVGTDEFASTDASTQEANSVFQFQWNDPGLNWSDGESIEVRLAAPKQNTPASGAPVITGTVQVGETLTVDTSGITDEDELTNVSYSYQWLAYFTDIDGATDSTYTLADAEEGKTIKVKVTFTDDEGNQESLTSGFTGEVAAKANSEPTGLPTIIGTAEFGETLTADTSGIADENGMDDVEFSYQWIRVDDDRKTEIEYAAASTYTPGVKDIHKKVKVEVTFTDEDGHQESLTSKQVGPVSFESLEEMLEYIIEQYSGEHISNLPREFWSATMTAASVEGNHVGFRSGENPAGSLDDPTFTYPPDLGETTVNLVVLGDDYLSLDYSGYLPRSQLIFSVNGQEFRLDEAVYNSDIFGIRENPERFLDWFKAVSGGLQWPRGDLSFSDGDTVSLSLKDTTPPVFSDESFVPRNYSNGAFLFSKDYDDVDPVNLPSPSAFTITSDDTAVTVGEIVPFLRSNIWLGQLSPAIKQGQTVTLSYTDPTSADDANALQDPYGNDAADFTLTLVNYSALQEDISQSSATGAPTISGTAQVRQVLTADTSRIADENGLTEVEYSYQWLFDDGTEIEGATGSTYMLQETDAGKAVKVKVSFRDDVGYKESLTSIATVPVAATVPTEPLSLTVATGDQIQELDVSWQAPSSNGDSAITGYKVQWKETEDSWDTESDVSEATVTGTSHTITSLTGGVEYTVRVIASNVAGDGPASTEVKGTPAGGASERQPIELANSAPTGLPTISGTPQVEQTLTADTSGIDDADGLTNVPYEYQWLAGGSDIAGATGSSYTLTSSEQGQTIQVRVTFTDDADNQETLTSEATEAVAAKPNTAPTGLPTISGTPQVEQTLTADTSGITDVDGLTNVSYEYQWLAGASEISGATGSSYLLTSSEHGQTIRVRVTFTDDADNQETLTSEATTAVAAKPNTAPTGLPTITGTPQVEQTLTVDTSGITDEDGLTNVSYEYQWIAGDTDIEGATGSSYTLTSSEQGQTIQVRVTFTDDADNQETLTSEATTAVAAKPDPLTVSVTAAAPATHDGSSEFTFEIEFSEEFGLSYVTLKNHAFNVTGGSVEKAQRTDKPSNIPWRITVKPQDNGDVTIELPATTDCGAQGAICTGDGRKLSNSLNFTVSGPGQ